MIIQQRVTTVGTEVLTIQNNPKVTTSNRTLGNDPKVH